MGSALGRLNDKGQAFGQPSSAARLMGLATGCRVSGAWSALGCAPLFTAMHMDQGPPPAAAGLNS
jgi:hypothetical protein